jgi:hypothetical protein
MIEVIVDKEVIKKMLFPRYIFILVIGFIGVLFSHIMLFMKKSIDLELLILSFCISIVLIFIIFTIWIWNFSYKIWVKRSLNFKISYNEITQNVLGNNSLYKGNLKNEKILRENIKSITKNLLGIVIISKDNRIIGIPKQIKEYDEVVRELGM